MPVLIEKGIVILIAGVMFIMGSFNIISNKQINHKQIIEHQDAYEIQFPMNNGEEVDLFIDKHTEFENAWAGITIKNKHGNEKIKYWNISNGWWEDENTMGFGEFFEKINGAEDKFIMDLVDTKYSPKSQEEYKKLIKELDKITGKKIVNINKYRKEVHNE